MKRPANTYIAKIAAAAMPGIDVRIEFELDKALPPQGGDQRELGVSVKAVALEPLDESRDTIDPIYVQQAYVEERLVASQERVREADRTIEQRSEWALRYNTSSTFGTKSYSDACNCSRRPSERLLNGANGL